MTSSRALTATVRLVATAAAVPLLAACGTGTTPFASAAARDVASRAERAGTAMARTPLHAPAVEHARRVVGGAAGSARIELMAAEGTGVDGTVVLRVSGVVVGYGFGQSTSSATACYRYDLGDRSGGTRAVEVDCPAGEPLPLPEPPADVDLPRDALERLARALGEPGAAAGAAAAFDDPGLRVATHSIGQHLGVAVSAGPGECAMGRRLPDGTVQTWRVPHVLALPGELGCDPQAAAAGLGATSPH